MSALAGLQNLPSRGTLVAVQPGAAFCAPPTAYIADHDTTPQQVVRCDPTSLLIRALHSKKAKEEAARRKPTKAAEKGKRPAEEAEGSGRAVKRPAGEGAGPSSSAGGSAAPAAAAGSSGAGPSGGGGVPPPATAHYSKLGLQAKTIKDLQNILKAWNLHVSGKKDDLITRILDCQAAHRGRS